MRISCGSIFYIGVSCKVPFKQSILGLKGSDVPNLLVQTGEGCGAGWTQSFSSHPLQEEGGPWGTSTSSMTLAQGLAYTESWTSAQIKQV